MEGDSHYTDARRGKGVHRRILSTFNLLNKENIFFGVSLTTTNQNYEYITKKRYINYLMAHGCKLFIFVDYIPIEKKTQGLVLNDKQRQIMENKLKTFNKSKKGVFLI